MFRAGDIVFHSPTQETWTLAFGDFEDGTGRVSPCGWPETLAYAEDCSMREPATDAVHEDMLNQWAQKDKSRDVRAVRCRRFLQSRRDSD